MFYVVSIAPSQRLDWRELFVHLVNMKMAIVINDDAQTTRLWNRDHESISLDLRREEIANIYLKS